MKIEFTEAEVAEIVRAHVIDLVEDIPSAIEFDCAYGYLRKVTVTIKTIEEDDSDA